MAGIVETVATNVAQSWADKVQQELHYLVCYKSYVDDFEDQKECLEARREDILKDIKEAQDRNENQIESVVAKWLRDADALLKEDTKGKQKWFGLVTNCFWQYTRGKDLEDKKQRIEALINKSNFRCVARSNGLPVIELIVENFLQLEDRKLKFGELTEALKNALENDKFVIGLYGLGGTGKTTMAKVVGNEVVESMVFDKVIFSAVKKDANMKEIRVQIASQLNLPLKDETDEYEQAQKLWKRIAGGRQKVLIILDNVWQELPLEVIGIPLGRHGESCCCILLTTRDRRVCIDMGCHEPIELKVLSEKDAVDLFLSYAGKSTDSSSDAFKDVALDIVKECGRLPVAITAVARALKSRHLNEWNDGLKRLRYRKLIHDVKGDLEKAYNSLKLSYKYLRKKEARKLFLLCSLFPDDYEIPIELLTRIAIGLGLCGGADEYSVARSYFTPIKNVLMDSCLLLNAENEAVKMHDLVREVALWIGNKLVQVVMDSSTTLREHVQYSSWNTVDFPSRFAGRNLEALLLLISNDAKVKVPDGIFEGMENLKFLALTSWSDISISGASLFQSRPPLTNVQSLAIKGSRLGDISFLVNLKCLESLELSSCSMIELPKGISELEKLRLLEIVHCAIKRNNPLEVIGSCRRLEELYFISQHKDKDTCESLAQIATFPKLERYHIKGCRHSKVDFSVSRCFDSRYLKANFSDEIFKSLVARAEVLKLGSYYSDKGWTNVVPDILPVKEDSLIKLRLKYINGMKCLVCTERLQSGVALFSKLAKLKLCNMDIRELCCGPYPVNFLKQLEKLHLFFCDNLKSSLFDGKLELCKLKSIFLHRCSMAFLFHPLTAQSLKQLEKLEIRHCFGLKYIVAQPMEDHDPNEMSHDSMFPKLKDLSVRYCAEIEFILPICFCKDLPLLESMEIVDCKKLEYLFGLYPNERGLHQMGKEAILQSLEGLEISQVPNFINLYAECYIPCPCSDEVQKSSPSINVEDSTSCLSWGRLCCCWPKSNASTTHLPSTCTNHNEAMMVTYVGNRAHGLFAPPLYPYTRLRRLRMYKLVGLESLFSVSIASSLKLLQILTVGDCDTLEHIVTDKEDDHDHMNVISIFPNLREVEVFCCSDLEYLFPAFYSKDFKDLEFVWIYKAEKLTHVFGKCEADDQNHNVQIDLNLPALKRVHLSVIPNIVGICAQNYSMKELYLEEISLNRSLELPSETLIEAIPPPEEKGKPLYSLQELPEFKEPKSYMSFQNLSTLTIKGCKQLKFVFSASTSRRLQKLRKLEVEACEVLVSIIEDQEDSKNPMAPHHVLFPELRRIKVKGCKSMEYLFSISSGKLPQLSYVDIEDTPQLGEVFRWKHREGQKLDMEDVFPKLYLIRLANLRSLGTICQGIDFHTLQFLLVRECPASSLSSACEYKEERNSVHEDEDIRYFKYIIWQWQSEIEVEGSQQDIGNDSTMPQQNSGSPNFENSEEVSKEFVAEDSTTNSNLPNLTKREEASKETDEKDPSKSFDD